VINEFLKLFSGIRNFHFINITHFYQQCRDTKSKPQQKIFFFEFVFNLFDTGVVAPVHAGPGQPEGGHGSQAGDGIQDIGQGFNFFYFGELWLLLAYLESAPRFFNFLWGLYRVNISTM
jgi:hypothetical protein